MEKIKRLLSRRLLLVTVVITLALIALPLMTCLYVYQNWSHRVMVAGCAAQMNDLIDTVDSGFKDDLTRISNAGISLGANSILKEEYVQSTPASQTTVTKLLQSCRGMLKVDNVFFAFDGSEHVYTADGTFYIPYYTGDPARSRNLVNADNIVFENALRICSSARGDTVLASDYDTVEILCPARYGSAFIGFQIRWSDLFSLDSRHVSVTLLDEGGRMLCTTDRSLLGGAEGTETAFPAEDGTFVTPEGEKYLVRTRRTNGAELVFLIDEDYFYAESLANDRRFFTLFGIVLLVCCCVTVLFVYHTYRPISRLQTTLRPFSDENARYKSEMENVEQAFTRLFSRYRSLEKSNQRHLCAGTVQALARDAAGVSGDRLAACGMSGLRGRMCFSIVRIHSRAEEGRQPAAESLLAAIPGDITAYTAPYHENKGLLLLTAASRDFRQDLEDAFRGFLADREGIYIGMGETVTRVEDLSASYLQARSALAMYHRGDSASPLLIYRPEEAEGDTGGIRESIAGLFNAIVSSDYRQSRVILDRIIEGISARREFPVLLCYDVINAILRAGQQNRLISQVLANEPDLFACDRVEFADASDFIAFANDLLDLILSAEEVRDDCFGRCCAYIQSHLLDPALCPEAVADGMGLSPGALQRVFREHTGVSPSAYILAMRQEYAKNQLLSTDITVRELAEQLGYSQASSFIRTFKREEGLTPGEYRQKHGIG